MKNYRKTTYVRLARRILLLALPALLFMLGSCSNEDEVIDLTSDDLTIEVFEEPNQDEALARNENPVKLPPEKIIINESEAEGRLNLSGYTRVIFSSGSNFSGYKTRYSNTHTSSSNYTWWGETIYAQSMVVPPYCNVYLTSSDNQTGQVLNSGSSTAKYVGQLATKFWASGRYIKQVSVRCYQQQSTEQFCGYAFTSPNFSGRNFPIFRSTGVSQSTAEGFGFHYFRSFQNTSNNVCTGVTFADTDYKVNNNSRVIVEGTNDNTSLAGWPDAFYPLESWDNLGLDNDTYSSADISNLIDGYALGVSDGYTSVSQTERDACLAGYKTCKSWMTALGAVSTIAAKVTCAGYSSMAALATTIIEAIRSDNKFLLGQLLGDSARIAGNQLVRSAYPFGAVGTGICIFAIIVKAVSGETSNYYCESLKDACDEISATTQQD